MSVRRGFEFEDEIPSHRLRFGTFQEEAMQTRSMKDDSDVASMGQERKASTSATSIALSNRRTSHHWADQWGNWSGLSSGESSSPCWIPS